MMVVSPPVMLPTYEPDFAAPGPSSGVVPDRAAFPGLPMANTYPTRPSPPPLQQRPTKIDSEVVVMSALPPTPDPSPPTTKVLFPVTMEDSLPIPPPTTESHESVDSRFSLDEGSASPPSSSESHASHSTNESTPRRLSASIATQPLSQSVRGLPSPPRATSMYRSETQPNLLRNLSRSSTGKGKEKAHDKEERGEGKERRAKSQRRQTLAAPTAPTSVKMTESRSADSRARLRSNGPPKLARYLTIANEYPSASAQARARSGRRTETPKIFVGSSSADTEDLDFGGPGGLEAKLVLLGSQGVGKTSLILRLTTNSYSAIPAPASLDGSLYKRKLVHNGVPVKLQIWDTAGQERFRSMMPIYYRGAHVCILVYDTSDRKSFQDVRSWLDELATKGSKDLIIYVVGAKTDLSSKRVISFAEARSTIRNWLKPPPAEPEPEVLLSPVPRSLFRSTSSKMRTEMSGHSPASSSDRRARPHSMHGLASLMVPTDYNGELELPTPGSSSRPSPSMLPPASPSPSPTVHFPFSVTSGGAGPSTSSVSSPTVAAAERHERKRTQRVSFHSPAPPSEPIFGTTTETATASTAPPSSYHVRSASMFSISGVLGLSRQPSDTKSDAVSNLTHLAEANPVSPRSARPPLSPVRVRTESSPMLSADLTKQRSEEWSSRAWARGERPRAAEALEEFGANVRQERSTSRPTSVPRRGRTRGGSLGRDSRIYGDDRVHSGVNHRDNSDDEDEPANAINGWGVEVEGVRLGEVSSLTGQGVEAMCRSISACLVERKDKIERERTLRHKNSVMLTDPTKDLVSTKHKGRFSCCA